MTETEDLTILETDVLNVLPGTVAQISRALRKEGWGADREEVGSTLGYLQREGIVQWDGTQWLRTGT